MLQPAIPPVTAPGTDMPADRLTALLSALVIPGDRATAIRLLGGAR